MHTEAQEMIDHLREINYNMTNKVFTSSFICIALILIIVIIVLLVSIYVYLSGYEKKRNEKKLKLIQEQNENLKLTVSDRSQLLTQELAKKNELQREVRELVMKIPPDVPPSKSHQIALVKLFEDGQKRCYKLVRIQDKTLPRRLKEIQKEYHIPNLHEPDTVKIWNDVPNAVKTGLLVRDFLLNKGLEVDGRNELIFWEYSSEKLYDIIEAFLSKGNGGERKAEEIFNKSY